MPRPLRMGPSCYHVLHLVPPTVAHEMNFFFDEGLHDEDGRETYELVADCHAPFMFERLTLGQTMKERGIDVTMDVKPSTIAYLQKQGREIYIIAGWRNQQPFYIIGSPGMISLSDLKGKRIGVIDFDDILATVASYWLQREGVDAAHDIDWVTGIDTRRAPGALRDGRVDAAFVDHIDAPQLLGEGRPKLLDVMEQYPHGRPDRVIAATARVIDEQPEEVKAFIKGMIRAYWFLRKQPDNIQVTQAIERRLRRRSPDPDERARMLQFGSAHHAEMMPFPIDGLPTGLEQYLEEAAVLGNVDGHVDVTSIARLDLAREAFAELAGREELRSDLERARQLVSRLGY